MSFGVYVHWPFCRSKCPYCDFNSHVHDSIDHAAWMRAYEREIAHTAALTPDSIVSTIFFGGGTPSLMEPETVAHVIDRIRAGWRCANDLEITLEANPTSAEAEKFSAFRAAGVNRLSLGVQSLRENDLAFLGRTHDASQAKAAIALAASVFPRVSFDMIYARPEQTINDWQDELSEAIALGASHMSLYQLTIERNTPFHIRHARGEFHLPVEELAADFYDATNSAMHRAGFNHYEVSNYARADQESRHNLLYWRYGDYAGIGPGAHGRLTISGEKYATRAHRAPEIWLDRTARDGHGLHPLEIIAPDDRLREALLMGLRLDEGVSVSRLNDELGGDAMTEINTDKITRLVNESLLSFDGSRLTAMPAGRRCLNAVLNYLLN